MKNWIKKDITKDQVKELCQKYGIDSLTASIFARREITKGNDILFYLEDDLRFLHNPFLFNQMEDAVDRILDAKDEGEKVLIFGDRDVDGITSTTILYEYLKSIGIDVTFKVPLGDEAYGMNIETIDEFAANYGTLIITVDCGIANGPEIAHASELGIDVIVTDHHNPPEQLPENCIIINPKVSDSGYPFHDISGCAVAFKLIQALRYASLDYYKEEICLLNACNTENGYRIDCVKLYNNLVVDNITIDNITDGLRISDTKLVEFLKGQSIFTWDDKETKKALKEIFGTAVEFNTFELRPEIAKIIPPVANLTLDQLNEKSKIARYNENQSSLLDGFVNIYITYFQQIANKAFAAHEQQELQLVGLAALADVMPLQNENRIFVNYALKIINSGKARRGLLELLSRLNLLNKRITATDLSWTLIPAINATGRLGQPELSIQILLEEDPSKRNEIADQIIGLNTERKSLVSIATELTSYNAQISYEKLSKICLVVEKSIHRGVIGLISSKLTQKYHVPSITITCIDDQTAIGSMRSCRGLECTQFLSQFAELFSNYGGHSKAAGFSLPVSNLHELQKQIEKAALSINLQDENDNDIIIDAELPASYINHDLFKIVDLFEPYGENNSTLTFMSKNLKIIGYQIVGKTEKQHLKLNLDSGEHKIPVMFWGAADKINSEFNVGDNINLVYNVERNVFNGMETLQLVALDIQK